MKHQKATRKHQEAPTVALQCLSEASRCFLVLPAQWLFPQDFQCLMVAPRDFLIGSDAFGWLPVSFPSAAPSGFPVPSGVFWLFSGGTWWLEWLPCGSWWFWWLLLNAPPIPSPRSFRGGFRRLISGGRQKRLRLPFPPSRNKTVLARFVWKSRP